MRHSAHKPFTNAHRRTLMPASQSSFATCILSIRRPSPTLMTYACVSFFLPFAVRPAATAFSRSFCMSIENTRSTPTLTPTQGILPLVEASDDAAEANMPTSSSYRPPAAMLPTPIVDSSTSGSPSASTAGILSFFFLDFGGADALPGAAAGIAAAGSGGAELSTTASYMTPV